jgi:type II secretory pathway component PulM
MKDWWMNLAVREKQSLIIGSACVFLFLLYELIWSPFTTNIDDMRNRIQHNQELLAWMQNADKRIETLEKSSKGSATQNTGSLLGIMQAQVNTSPFAKSVKQLRQSDNESVQLSLQKIDFDKLVIWLAELGQKQGIIVDQMAITPGDAPGVINANFIVKRS